MIEVTLSNNDENVVYKQTFHLPEGQITLPVNMEIKQMNIINRGAVLSEEERRELEELRELRDKHINHFEYLKEHFPDNFTNEYED